MDMETWTHGQRQMDMDTQTWTYGHGHMDMDTQTWTHGPPTQGRGHEVTYHFFCYEMVWLVTIS
jgi:hypothetical protein